MTTQQTNVTQADREAGKRLTRLIMGLPISPELVLVNATHELARHRTATEAASRAEVERLRVIAGEAAFLLDRLRDLDWSQDYDDFANSYDGHVDPSECRLRSLIADYRAALSASDAGGRPDA